MTEMPVSDLEAYYRPQLEAAGWSLETSNSDEHVAWSSWLVTRSDAASVLGFFLVVAEPGRPYRWLRVHTHPEM
jgi:hypothetical protein